MARISRAHGTTGSTCWHLVYFVFVLEENLETLHLTLKVGYLWEGAAAALECSYES